ncbi:hypothetical protein [Natronorubrum daqingense]|nr:hypothetical protein [Natronorubrum daqingense]SIS09887.1 hypothetical protein SAMN05421809_3874 [Natronorubrum daqingense]
MSVTITMDVSHDAAENGGHYAGTVEATEELEDALDMAEGQFCYFRSMFDAMRDLLP